MKRLIISIIVLASINSIACTNFLITKKASVDGSNMITYAADAGGLMDPLYFKEAADHKPGTMIDIYEWDTGKYLGKIKQVAHTYKVIGNINEHQLCIGETTFGGLDSLRDTTAILDYGSLIQIVLQRAKTAREAIKLIDELTKEYGYYSSGESFSIADSKEVWVMDLISKGMYEKGIVYVARRIPDGCIAAHANQSRIKEVIMNNKDECIYSADVISFAKKIGKYKEYNGQFSFSDTYNPLDVESALFCEGRVWRFYTLAAPELGLKADYFRGVKGATPYPLYVKVEKKISVKDLMRWMRDHFEGTEYDMTKGVAAGSYGCPVRWKGLEWKLPNDTINKFAWERPISTQQTAFSFVAQLRDWLPNEIGGCFWYGVDHAATSCYIPLYLSMKENPKSLRGGSNKEFDMQSAWWVFNLVSNKAYQFYKFVIEDIKKVQANHEDKFIGLQPYIEKTALEIMKSDTNNAKLFLSDYSINQVESTVENWRDLWKYITVKYNDGYINDVNKNNGRTPKGIGYDPNFLKKVTEDKPDYYNVRWRTPN
jgi:dipeptidase